MQSDYISSQIYAKICFETTLGQKKVVENLSEWLKSDDFSRIFILNGHAGTGKTTIVSAFVKVLNDLKINTVLLAPTGRAAKVLSRSAEKKAHTIHKRIYRERTDAQYVSKFSLNQNLEYRTIFIVDEASMLSDGSGDGQMFGSGSLLDDLVSYVRSGKECRLMLIGDSAQLPPVGCDESPALDEGRMYYYGDVLYCTLDDVVRQKAQSGILFNATLVREMLERGIYQMPRFDTNYEDIHAIGGGDFLECLEDSYAKYSRDEVVVITRSNKRANRFNEGVRRNVLYAEEAVESGDMLMVVKNNYSITAKEDAEQGTASPMNFIANGDIALLKRIRRFESLYGFEFATAELEFSDYDNTTIECKILLNTLSSESPSLTREESQQLFMEVEKDYLDTKSKIKRLAQIRENEHFNALQVKFAYAVTCHKAQGGEWRAVFIDRCLFGDEPMSRDMLRWLYTALTRASDRVYLVNYDID